MKQNCMCTWSLAMYPSCPQHIADLLKILLHHSDTRRLCRSNKLHTGTSWQVEWMNTLSIDAFLFFEMLPYSLFCFVWLPLGSHNKGQKSLHKTLQMKKIMQHNPIWRTTGECKQRPTSHQPVTVPPPQAWQPSVSEEMDGLHPWQGTVWCQAVTHQSWNAL